MMEQFKREERVQYKNREIFPHTLTVDSYDMRTSKYHCFYFTRDQIFQEVLVHEDFLKVAEKPPRGSVKYR